MNIILKKDAIESLNKIFSLPYSGVEQDWELEMANPDRLLEFISHYKKENLSIDKKIALMSLIVASYNDFLDRNSSDTNRIWDEIKSILESEIKVFSNLIAYWSVYSEGSSENYFNITPLIRTIKIPNLG